MSELEHALRSALADPPGALSRDADALYDIEVRLTRRRRRRRRTGFGALVVAAVAAVAVPIGVAGPHLGSGTSNGSAARRADVDGGAAAPEPRSPTAPAAVRKAAQRAADASGAKVSGPVRWVRTSLSRIWALEPPNRGIRPADRAIYVVELTGSFRCVRCASPAGPGHHALPTVKSELIIVPVAPRAGDRSPAATQGQTYRLARLGAVHTFTLH